MIVVTGKQGSGKSTTRKHLGELLELPTYTFFDFLKNINNVDQYRLTIDQLVNQKCIIECGLPEAFNMQLLECNIFTILVNCDEQERYNRLMLREGMSMTEVLAKYKQEFAGLDRIEYLIKPDMSVHTSELEKVNVKLITEHLSRSLR